MIRALWQGFLKERLIILLAVISVRYAYILYGYDPLDESLGIDKNITAFIIGMLLFILVVIDALEWHQNHKFGAVCPDCDSYNFDQVSYPHDDHRELSCKVCGRRWKITLTSGK